MNIFQIGVIDTFWWGSYSMTISQGLSNTEVSSFLLAIISFQLNNDHLQTSIASNNNSL